MGNDYAMRLEALLSGNMIKDLSHDNIGRMHNILLQNIKANLPKLKQINDEMRGHYVEDRFYRFYHHSFKVYDLQLETERNVEMLKLIAPEGARFCSYFCEIIRDGVGKRHKWSHNNNWCKHTRPILEAFWHTREMLALAVKYGEELQEAPNMLPSGWAALLSLYGIR